MPSENPLFKGGFGLDKFTATVINDIWPEVTFFTLIALMVTAVSEFTSTQLSTSPQLLTVLGTVLGLVISFRTSTAYERYQEGRKLWTNITMGSRTLAQMVWVHVPAERDARPGQPETTVLQNVIEKKTMINLIQAFSVSLKHYLRGESGIYYRDLYPLVCVLPRYVNAAHSEEMFPLWHASDHFGPQHADPQAHHTPANRNPRDSGEKGARTSSLHSPEARTESPAENGNGTTRSWLGRGRKSKKQKWDPESILSDVQPDTRPLKPAREPPRNSLYDYVPILRLFKWMFRRAASVRKSDRNIWGKKNKPVHVESNVPLEITLQLHSYFNYLLKNGLLQPAIAVGMVSQITMLQDTFSNLDRIMNTPLPFAYQAHLRMSLWLYLFFLPFQVWQFFHWVTIPGTAFASFLLLGFLEIGQEIENPFEYDPNDLDLDSFCLGLQREIHEITANTAPSPQEFMFSAWNQPFAPTDRRTAEQLCRDGAHSYDIPGEEREKRNDIHTTRDNIRLTMLRNWKGVDYATREAHHK